jgi:serine/threonine-protein kinase RsbT
MATMREGQVHVRIQSSADIVTARQQGRALAAQTGFANGDLPIIAAAISEVARNIVEYAKEGEIIMRILSAAHRRGIEILASDHGPGIADISTVMRDGYSTGDGLGIGLPGARRLMDEFEITSVVGKGTMVRMTKWVD